MDAANIALERAQAAGAAPGTEPPADRAMCAKVDGGVRRALLSRLLAALAALCLVLAAWHGGHAAYLHAKAALGQHLLLRAWDQARESGTAVKPWPWADTHPVARLSAPAHGVELLVLAGASGSTLAWGPAHVGGTAAPGAPGTAVITGHRDTHFGFLRDLKRGDALLVESADGSRRRYRVESAFVGDRSGLPLPADERAITLALVTCYPFGAVDPGTSQRYVVVARAEAY